MNKTPVTKLGEQLLRDELQHLKHVERPAVITAISEARAQGDLPCADERCAGAAGARAENEQPADGEKLDGILFQDPRPGGYGEGFNPDCQRLSAYRPQNNGIKKGR